MKIIIYLIFFFGVLAASGIYCVKMEIRAYEATRAYESARSELEALSRTKYRGINSAYVCKPKL